MLGDVLDLPHDADELVDADEVLPEGIEQTTYRKRLQLAQKCKNVVERSEVNMLRKYRFPDFTNQATSEINITVGFPMELIHAVIQADRLSN